MAINPLFDLDPPTSLVDNREEERFGKWDALTGLSLRNHYSDQISGERLDAYTRGFRAARLAMLEGWRRLG